MHVLFSCKCMVIQCGTHIISYKVICVLRWWPIEFFMFFVYGFKFLGLLFVEEAPLLNASCVFEWFSIGVF